MSNQFPALFKPLEIRHKTLRNRIVFCSHTANMSVNGRPGERHRGYYEERARGGVGMIVVEPVPVDRTGVLTRGNFLHSTDEIIPHFRKITDAVKEAGAVILQLVQCRFGANSAPVAAWSGRSRARSAAITAATPPMPPPSTAATAAATTTTST